MPTNNSKIERRSFAEVRASQGDEFAITGYACLYNNESKDLGGFREIVAPGAFDTSLKSGRDVQFCFNHSQDAVLARTSNGTLTLSSDDKGLKFRAALNPKIQSHRDIWEACRSGLYNECSYAFKVKPDGEKWNARIRTLVDVDLFDVSLVGQPAYSGTSASARSAGTIPTTAELKARLAKIDGSDSVIAREDQQRRARAEALGKQIDGKAIGDGASMIACERSFDDDEDLLDELQDMADARYGVNRFKVVDCERDEDPIPPITSYGKSTTRCRGTAILRDMLSDTEDFFAVDYDEDEDDQDDQRSLSPSEVSSRKKLRFVSNRRRVMPHGTRWQKSQRALDAASEWYALAGERDMRARISSVSR